MGEPTRIDFERSGGVTGTHLKLSLDGGDLPPAEAAELDEIARKLEDQRPVSEPGPTRGADTFQFDIDVARDGRQHRLTLRDDAIPPELQPVIDRLVDLARRARRDDTSNDPMA